MGRVGAYADNAAKESFFALLQKNVLNPAPLAAVTRPDRPTDRVDQSQGTSDSGLAGAVHPETHRGDFAVDVIRRDRSERVVVGGELNGSTAPLLFGVLDTVYGRHPRRLEVDLSGLTGLTPQAIIGLVAGHRRAGRAAELAFLDPNPIARRVLALIGLDRLVEYSVRTVRGPFC